MTKMLVVATAIKTTAAKIVKLGSLKDLSQIKIQARFSKKLMDRVMVTDGVRICGLMYNL